MRPLRYSINMTVDGCCDHLAITPDEDVHRFAMEQIARADGLLFGRVTYEMMESAWRPPGILADVPEWMLPFAREIDAARKYVVTSTLESVDWNAEIVPGDLETFVRDLKEQPGGPLYTGGMQLPLALANLDLIDSYEFLVWPRIAGHGPYLFAGLTQHVDLRLTGRQDLASGAFILTYEPVRD
ncbi:dihydrofolate reductase family protein [Sporichthya brevicatena]|uniref:Dihydrofolate reductase family protein n=1 Tax=Sporichthya brevicatena TaxID=171442 RepID=A0ABN1HBG9_9ACTN